MRSIRQPASAMALTIAPSRTRSAVGYARFVSCSANGAPAVLSIAVDIVKDASSEATAKPLMMPSSRVATSVWLTRSRVRASSTRYSQG
jgi:hypothetical protein